MPRLFGAELGQKVAYRGAGSRICPARAKCRISIADSASFALFPRQIERDQMAYCLCFGLTQSVWATIVFQPMFDRAPASCHGVPEPVEPVEDQTRALVDHCLCGAGNPAQEREPAL